MNAVLSEIKKWNTKYLRKLEKQTNALAVNIPDNSETTHKSEKVHRPNSTTDFSKTQHKN
jgi:hypothetical protein